MSKRAIEGYITKAIEVLESRFENGVIPSSYNGYISSFGASVIQSGLKPTLALFENENANTKEKKQLLPMIILQILDSNTNETSLLRYVIHGNEALLKQKIMDISIAVKLSIRTFKLEKGSKNE